MYFNKHLNVIVIIVIMIMIIIIFFKPSKNEGRKKIEKVKKNGEANVPSGRPYYLKAKATTLKSQAWTFKAEAIGWKAKADLTP